MESSIKSDDIGIEISESQTHGLDSENSPPHEYNHAQGNQGIQLKHMHTEESPRIDEDEARTMPTNELGFVQNFDPNTT